MPWLIRKARTSSTSCLDRYLAKLDKVDIARKRDAELVAKFRKIALASGSSQARGA